MIQRLLTAEEFADHRVELPDGGQWSELVRGAPVSLQPPDLEHGTIVLNLSKAFATYVQDTLNGYACFDLGLHVEQRPDTVFFPAACYFIDGPRFAESDRVYTATTPVLVVELLTSPDRRRHINERVGLYLQAGVSAVWLIDPQQRTVHVVRAGAIGALRLSESETLSGDPVLAGFQTAVGGLFIEPPWARAL